VLETGETDTVEPVWVPRLLSMLTAGAGLPVTDQDKVLDWPVVIAGGLAVKDEITGGAEVTVTVVCCVVVPR
jgi:hypothetical protein